MNKVIFDNECLFCENIKNRFKRLDLFNLFSWIPSNEYLKSSSIHYSVTSEMIKSSMVVITSENRVLLEFDGCRYIMTRIPYFYPILILLYLPYLSSYVGNKVYKKIAKNRMCYVR